MQKVTDIIVDNIDDYLNQIEEFSMKCIENGQFIFTMGGEFEFSQKETEEEKAREWLDLLGPIVKNAYEGNGVTITFDYDKNYIVFDVREMVGNILVDRLKGPVQ